MFAINMRATFVALIILSAFAMMVGTVFAGPGNSGDTKPGWGFGDKNHEHTGPPGGPSVHPNKP